MLGERQMVLIRNRRSIQSADRLAYAEALRQR
jgi:hypothetical protein